MASDYVINYASDYVINYTINYANSYDNDNILTILSLDINDDLVMFIRISSPKDAYGIAFIYAHLSLEY